MSDDTRMNDSEGEGLNRPNLGLNVVFEELVIAGERLAREREITRDALVPTLNLHVVQFLVNYAATKHRPTLLLPWLQRDWYRHKDTISVRDAMITTAGHNRAIALNVGWDEDETGLRPSDDGYWELSGDPLSLMNKLDERFSLVVGVPPVGAKPEWCDISYDGRSVRVRDELGNLIVLKSSMKLTADGVGLFVVPPSFMTGSRNKVFRHMPELGLYVNAVISVPTSSQRDYSTRFDTSLLVVSREDYGDLFVGELTDSPQHNEALLNNLLERRPGEFVQLGVLVKHAEYTSISDLVQKSEIERLVTEQDLDPIMLGDVAMAINLTKEKEASGFDEVADAVYLPLIGKRDAVTSLSNLQLNAHNYAQIVINSQIADATYVASFFNSPLGQLVRESGMAGHIPKLSKERLGRLTIYLPSLEQQLRTLDIDSNIRNRVSELSELQRQLWSSAAQLIPVSDRLQALDSLTSEERFMYWLDSLPFPLASILWTYQASGNDFKARYEIIMHFFEALAEFLATILLSAYVAEATLFAEVRDNIKRSLDQLPTSSFATWHFLWRILAEDARERRIAFERKGEGIDIQRSLRAQNEEVMGLLLNKRMAPLLKEVNTLRNTWIGHTGYVGSREAAQRHTTAQQHLTAAREIIGRRWQDYRLIRPGKSEYDQGVYTYEVEQLVGSSTPFQRGEIRTTVPLEVKALYIWTDGEDRPLQLLPLIKILPSPSSEENACYFYNRIDTAEGTARYVAYHFIHGAEVKLRPSEVGEVLRPLLPKLFED